MRYVIEMIREGWNLIPYDPDLRAETIRTLRLAFESTGIALLIGVVPAYLIGVRTSRPARWGLTIANAGLGVPAVGVGVLLFLILPGHTPWPGGGLWYGMSAMILGQTVLALPIIVALGAAAIRGLPDGLIDQARAFGASGWRLAIFAFREAKIGILTAIILALGSAIAEVGAVTILGGNAERSTTTLASEILNEVNGDGGFAGNAGAVEHAIVVLGLMLILAVMLTVIQQWGAIQRRGRLRAEVSSSQRTR